MSLIERVYVKEDSLVIPEVKQIVCHSIMVRYDVKLNGRQ